MGRRSRWAESSLCCSHGALFLCALHSAESGGGNQPLQAWGDGCGERGSWRSNSRGMLRTPWSQSLFRSFPSWRCLRWLIVASKCSLFASLASLPSSFPRSPVFLLRFSKPCARRDRGSGAELPQTDEVMDKMRRCTASRRPVRVKASAGARLKRFRVSRAVKQEASANPLAQLSEMTVLSVDTGDLDTVKRMVDTGLITDATTNPLFVSQAGQSGNPVYQAMVDEAVRYAVEEIWDPDDANGGRLGLAVDRLAVNLGAAIASIVPPRRTPSSMSKRPSGVSTPTISALNAPLSIAAAALAWLASA